MRAEVESLLSAHAEAGGLSQGALTVEISELDMVLHHQGHDVEAHDFAVELFGFGEMPH
jgi:hypothetical protein